MSHVIVVGAGPAGAVLSLLLTRAGVNVTLLERHTDFAREFRGELLMPGGLETLFNAGLWPVIEASPHITLKQIQLFANGKAIRKLDLGSDIFGRFVPRWISQPELLENLMSEANRSDRFTLERGATVRHLIEEEGRTRGVRILTQTGERELRGDLVVGADGRTSMVRERSGLNVRTFRAAMDVVWLKLPMPQFENATDAMSPRFYIRAGSLSIVAPTPDDRLQLAWIIKKGSYGDLRKAGFPHLIDRIADHVDPVMADHLRAHREDAIQPFLLSVVSDHVKTWSSPGLFLLGDAAHTMSPVGAQGLNVAIRDAVVAANHLAPVCAGDAHPAAIDAATAAIEKERRTEISRIQFLQSLPPKVFLKNTWWRRWILSFLPGLLGGQMIRPRNKGPIGLFFWGASEVKSNV